MPKSRVEAFTDGVLAIIITIMVLELHDPQGSSFAALAQVGTTFLTYLLSFVYVGIYWSNHHHLFQLVTTVHGGVLWANLHLLFWLSLIPFTTGWMDDTHFATAPVVLYGADLLACALAWQVLERSLVASPDNRHLGRAVGTSHKEWLSLAGYAAAIGASFVSVWVGVGLLALMAVLWLVPDRRFEREATVTREHTAS